MKSYCLSFLCICLLTLDANAESKIFTLKQAVLFATMHSPSFDTIKREVSIANLEKESSKSRFLPSLDLSATHGIQDSSPRTAGPWGSELRLDLTENLYDNGVTLTNYQLASLRKQQAELQHEEQKNKLCLEIVTQFLSFSLNVKLLEIQEKQFKNINKQYELISKYYYQGVRTKNDYLRFKTQVSRAEIDLINSKNNLLKSKLEMQRLIGGDLINEEPYDFIPITFDNIEDDHSLNFVRVENHLIYKSAQIQKEINALNLEIIAKKNLPEWFVSTGVGYDNSQYVGRNQSFSTNDRISWNALLTVKYNIFDWGIRSRNKEVSAAKNAIQNNALDSDLLVLKSTLKQFVINILQVKKNYELAKELLYLEKNNIDYIEREYRNGKIQYLDLITGLNNLTDAQIKYYSSALDIQTVKYTSLYHHGKLYEELLK